MSGKAGNRIAALREKFSGKGSGGFVPTPEHQFGRMKKTKEANARAVKVAKARAARYNMTLRALAIQTHTDSDNLKKKDQVAKLKAKEANSKFKGTSRAFKVDRSIEKRDKENIARALDDHASPTLAKNVIKAVAKKETIEVKRLSVKLPPKVQVDEEDVQTDDEGSVELPSTVQAVVPVEEKVEKPVVEEEKPAVKEPVAEEEPVKQKVEMTGMHEALASGDDQALNKAILDNFLSSHAPHMAGQSDKLLEQFSTQLDVLFKGLLSKFPNEVDAEISGQQKADKEITDAVENGDKEIPTSKSVDEESDDSIVMDEDNIDKFEEIKEEKKKASLLNLEEFKLDAVTTTDNEDDEEDSFVDLAEEQDKRFSRGYNKAIRKAEQTDTGVLKSLARRKTTLKIDATLGKEVNVYKKEARESLVKSMQSVEPEDEDESDDSLVETGPNYIVNFEEQEQTEEAGETVPVRWAVQFENKNYALKKKLLKQGLTEDQVSQLVDNLDNNTSEML